MSRDARFYFANLGADVARCIAATERGNEKHYQDSLDRAYATLNHLRGAARPEAYEEGQLMLRALEYARTEHTLPGFSEHLNKLIAAYAPFSEKEIRNSSTASPARE